MSFKHRIKVKLTINNFFSSFLSLQGLLPLFLYSGLPSGFGRRGNNSLRDTFGFLVFGSNPKYFTSKTSPSLKTSDVFSMRFQSNSDTCNNESFPGTNSTTAP